MLCSSRRTVFHTNMWHKLKLRLKKDVMFPPTRKWSGRRLIPLQTAFVMAVWTRSQWSAQTSEGQLLLHVTNGYQVGRSEHVETVKLRTNTNQPGASNHWRNIFWCNRKSLVLVFTGNIYMLTQTISRLTMMKPDWCLLEDIKVFTLSQSPLMRSLWVKDLDLMWLYKPRRRSCRRRGWKRSEGNERRKE